MKVRNLFEKINFDFRSGRCLGLKWRDLPQLRIDISLTFFLSHTFKSFAKREMKMFDDAVWKLTASLILMKPSMDERQLFTLTRAPVKLFQADAMRTIVECWNW